MALIFSTHPLHPRAAAMLADAGSLFIASRPDADVLLREGQDADIVIVRAPLPEALFAAGAGGRGGGGFSCPRARHTWIYVVLRLHV